MGRAKRRRNKRRQCRENVKSLDHEEVAITLKKFMSSKGWKNETFLKLKDFPVTGRGLASTRAMHPDDVLIRVPLELMITFRTIAESLDFDEMFIPDVKLKIQELLAIFLIVERSKGQDSPWEGYVRSLPPEPPPLPLLLSGTKSLPEFGGARNLFEESARRVEGSIRGRWKNCVLDANNFAWGYVLVNTRAVYINPEGADLKIRSAKLDILADEPCMALCPYLDMFNHNDKAVTNSRLTLHEGRLVYELTTMTPFPRHAQIFISYGSHDNLKLLSEYGFFIPGNSCDSVSFKREEVLQLLKSITLNSRQYKFICSHIPDKDMYVNNAGPSFNLKSCLFVALYSEVQNFSSVIYGDAYPEDFKLKCTNCLRELLRYKLTKSLIEVEDYQKLDANSDILANFLQYRAEYIKHLHDSYD